MMLSIRSGAAPAAIRTANRTVIGIATRVALVAVAAGLAACGSDSATGVPTTHAQIRIVNSVFKYTDATSTASKTTPAAIDVLIDSSTTSPGMAAIAPNSIAALAGADAAGYAPAAADVHTFVAQLAGTTGPTATFFTNLTTNLAYLPHMYLAAGTPYTMVVAGIVPATPAAGAPVTLVPSTAAPFVVLTDDPFPPPQTNGAYQARFRVINAAPFAASTGLGTTFLVYLTPGSTAPTTVTGLTSSATAIYRNSSVYVNADPGTYVLTLTTSPATTAKIVAQSTITLAAGEVRSYVVQSTGYAAVPSPANSTVTSLLDNKY